MSSEDILKEFNNQFTVLDINKNFIYPTSFLDMINSCKDKSEIPYYEPIYFLGKFPDNLIQWDKNIKKQYPYKNVIPFAKNENTDDVFCFDGNDTSGNPKVLTVHTFTTPGWEDRESFESFDEWLEMAQEFSKEFKGESV
jgi:hypothetical protein